MAYVAGLSGRYLQTDQETTKAEFNTLPIEARSAFREHLVANGVYVPKQRGMMVSQALYNAA